MSKKMEYAGIQTRFLILLFRKKKTTRSADDAGWDSELYGSGGTAAE